MVLQLEDQEEGQQYLCGPMIEGGEAELRCQCVQCGQPVGPIPFQIPAPNLMGDSNADTENEDGFDVECTHCGHMWNAGVMSSAMGGIYIQCDGAHPTDVEVRITHDNMADSLDDMDQEAEDDREPDTD